MGRTPSHEQTMIEKRVREVREGAESAEEWHAAVRVQAKMRQKLAMREAEVRRHTKKAKELSVFSDHAGAGHAVNVIDRRQKSIEDGIFDDQVKAAKKIQAIHRGNKARASFYEKRGMQKGSRSSQDA